MKKVIIILSTLILVLIIAFNKTIITFFKNFNTGEKQTIIIPNSNNYKKNINYLYVQKTDKFIPNNYQELINIMYTFLDNGWESFTFYCDDDYNSCIDDVYNFSKDNVLLTNINNFVHPYNSYKTLKISYTYTGEVTLEIEKLYLTSQIEKIDTEINNYIKNNITNEMDNEDKIKAFHDYVINKTKYDTDRIDVGLSEYNSSTAYGPLLEGYAVCGGYSDAMAIFLSKLNINNFKVASKDHVWNAVYLDNRWVHLDLTWDDPVDDAGNEYLIHKYFLVNTTELESLDQISHTFDKNFYLELK